LDTEIKNFNINKLEKEKLINKIKYDLDTSKTNLTKDRTLSKINSLYKYESVFDTSVFATLALGEKTSLVECVMGLTCLHASQPINIKKQILINQIEYLDMELYELYKSDKNYLRINEITKLKKEIQETIDSLEKPENNELEFSCEINNLSFSDFVISQFVEILESMSDKIPDSNNLKN